VLEDQRKIKPKADIAINIEDLAAAGLLLCARTDWNCR
jgi:hypothetical protein